MKVYRICETLPGKTEHLQGRDYDSLEGAIGELVRIGTVVNLGGWMHARQLCDDYLKTPQMFLDSKSGHHAVVYIHRSKGASI